MIYKFGDMITTSQQQRRIVTMSGRDMAKTYYSRPLLLFSILEGHAFFPLWVSYTHDKVQEEVEEIFNITQTPAFQYHYGNVVTSNNKTEIHFSNGALLLGKSVGQQIRGITHAGKKIDLLLLDDVETRDTVSSQADTAMIRRKVLSDLMGSMDSNKRRVFAISNFIDQQQFMADLYEATPEEDRAILPLYRENGEILWPERFVHHDSDLSNPGNEGKTSIESIRREYQNQPGGERIFREDFLADPSNPSHRYHDLEKILQHSEKRPSAKTINKRGVRFDVWSERDDTKRYVVGVDCAMGANLDFTVASIFKYSNLGMVLVAQGHSNAVPLDVFANALLDFCTEYGIIPFINFDALQGGSFETTIRSTINDNLIYRQEKQDEHGNITYTNFFGYKTNVITNKVNLCDKAKLALESGEMITFSEEVLTEAEMFTNQDLIRNYVRPTYETVDETVKTHFDYLDAHRYAYLGYEQAKVRGTGGRRRKPSLGESGFYDRPPPKPRY